jgi:hypothetical protein
LPHPRIQKEALEMDMRKCLTGLAAAVLAAAPLFAQETRGRVQGAVTDESGGIIPGATVTLTNGATGISASRVSNRDGRYLFDYVDPGLYSITVELTGFGTVVQPNVVVQQRGDVTVDVGLKVGAIQEIVTVTESPVAVQFNTASHDLTVEQRLGRTSRPPRAPRSRDA